MPFTAYLHRQVPALLQVGSLTYMSVNQPPTSLCVIPFFLYPPPPKPLNFERKKTYTLHIEGMNTHVDPRFSYIGSFKDTTMLKITVGDVDEAPVFSMDYYIMDVYENAPSGTEVGAVTARDPDSRNSPVR